MQRFAITDFAVSAEIDLWSSLFSVVEITKDNEDEVDRLLREANSKLREAKSHGDLIKILGAKLDVLLEPAAGGKKKASTLVNEKWNAKPKSEVTVAQVLRLFEAIEEQISRPT